MMQDNIIGLIEFVIRAEKLKTQLRHSWTSDADRQESVADHSWMLALMAMVLPEMLDIEIDRDKLVRMVIVHDLAEAITGDIPPFEKHSKQLKDKYVQEKEALLEFVEPLPDKLAEEIIDLWEEMETKETIEAKVAQCIDKSEVLIQHNIADISTWDQDDYDIGVYHKDEYFDFNKILRAFRDEINSRNWKKLKVAGKTGRLKKEQTDRAEKEGL